MTIKFRLPLAARSSEFECCARLLSGINDPKGLSVSDDEEYDDAYKEIHARRCAGGALPARAGRARKGGEFRMDRHERRQAPAGGAAPDAQGIIRGFVEIAPEAGWHTYWKVPGSGGIPPQVTIRDGGNVRLSKLEFPAPRVFEDGGLRDFGYDARVMLPLTLTQEKVGASSSVNASIFIGLCGYLRAFPGGCVGQARPDDKPKSTELALVNAASALLPEARVQILRSRTQGSMPTAKPFRSVCACRPARMRGQPRSLSLGRMASLSPIRPRSR